MSLKVLIYGSTLLTQKAVELLKTAAPEVDLVGFVKSRNPTVAGKVALTEVQEEALPKHDIKLILGYDLYIKDWQNCYNVHPGLLPEYGGCDILHHTVVNKDTQQGLTFQKTEADWDSGPIISKIGYTVLPTDTVMDLYTRTLSIYPAFVLSALKLLTSLPPGFVDGLPKAPTPCIYRRGKIADAHKQMYADNFELLKKFEASLNA